MCLIEFTNSFGTLPCRIWFSFRQERKRTNQISIWSKELSLIHKFFVFLPQNLLTFNFVFLLKRGNNRLFGKTNFIWQFFIVRYIRIFHWFTVSVEESTENCILFTSVFDWTSLDIVTNLKTNCFVFIENHKINICPKKCRRFFTIVDYMFILVKITILFSINKYKEILFEISLMKTKEKNKLNCFDWNDRQYWTNIIEFGEMITPKEMTMPTTAK